MVFDNISCTKVNTVCMNIITESLAVSSYGDSFTVSLQYKQLTKRWCFQHSAQKITIANHLKIVHMKITNIVVCLWWCICATSPFL